MRDDKLSHESIPQGTESGTKASQDAIFQLSIFLWYSVYIEKIMKATLLALVLQWFSYTKHVGYQLNIINQIRDVSVFLHIEWQYDYRKQAKAPQNEPRSDRELLVMVFVLSGICFHVGDLLDPQVMGSYTAIIQDKLQWIPPTGVTWEVFKCLHLYLEAEYTLKTEGNTEQLQ